jgi:hypothetical protein
MNKFHIPFAVIFSLIFIQLFYNYSKNEEQIKSKEEQVRIKNIIELEERKRKVEKRDIYFNTLDEEDKIAYRKFEYTEIARSLETPNDYPRLYGYCMTAGDSIGISEYKVNYLGKQALSYDFMTSEQLQRDVMSFYEELGKLIPPIEEGEQQVIMKLFYDKNCAKIF